MGYKFYHLRGLEIAQQQLVEELPACSDRELSYSYQSAINALYALEAKRKKDRKKQEEQKYEDVPL